MAGNPLSTIMNPASIAITGASNNLVKMGTIQMMNLVNSGFKGEIMPIHPKEKKVLGRKAGEMVEIVRLTVIEEDGAADVSVESLDGWLDFVKNVY